MNLEISKQNTLKNLKNVIERGKNKGIDLSDLEKFLEDGIFEKYVSFLGGKQISGSLSPFIHTFSSQKFKEKKLFYFLIDLETQNLDLDKTLSEIEKNEKILGSNVTMPYKIEVFKNLEKKGNLDQSAILVGATNTLSKNENGELIGYNSDMDGILLPIKQKLKNKIKEIKKGYILGNGGAALSAISALLVLGITQITILSRRENENISNHFSCEKIKKILREKYLLKEDISIKYKEYDVTNDKINKISEIIDEKGIIINTLPFGFKENLPKSPILEEEFEKIKDKISLFFDIVYDMNNGDTTILKLAKKYGIATCDGIDMLLNQAVKGFNLWTKGEKLDLEVLEKIFR